MVRWPLESAGFQVDPCPLRLPGQRLGGPDMIHAPAHSSGQGVRYPVVPERIVVSLGYMEAKDVYEPLLPQLFQGLMFLGVETDGSP